MSEPKKLRPQDRTLLAANDLRTAGFLYPSTDWQVVPGPMEMRVPRRVRLFVKQNLPEIIGTVVAGRLGLTRAPVPETTQIDLVTELADVIFQIIPHRLLCKYRRSLRANIPSEFAGYVLLAIWAKQLGESGEKPLLWQTDRRIVWLRENHREILRPA